MNTEETYNKLAELTEGLLYMSETESEFSVYEVEEGIDLDSFMEDVADQPRANFKVEDYTRFTTKVLASLDIPDEVMQQMKAGFTALFDFISNTFTEVKVLVGGDIEKHIFIHCSSKENGEFLLHTSAVES
jgi:hypothetical protein